MSVPQFKEFFKPILTFMSGGELHTNKELREKVIEYFNLDETDINEKTKSGKITRVEDRVIWTIQYFRRSRLIQTISRGQYQVTPRGKKVFKEDIDILDEKYLKRFKEFRDFSIPKKSTKKNQPKKNQVILKNQNQPNSRGKWVLSTTSKRKWMGT